MVFRSDYIYRCIIWLGLSLGFLMGPVVYEGSAMTDPPKGTRVAAYYRCSTDGQEHSVEGQKSIIHKEAEKKGWLLVAEYEDEGESGATTDNRPGLQRLLRDSGNMEFDLALMYDVSRITRGGTGEFWWLVHKFKQSGIRLYCCSRKLIANEKNALLFTVDAMQAREENIKRSRDATRGLYQSIFDRDQDPGRRPPFAFDQMRVEIATNKPVERIRFRRDGSKLIMTPDASTVVRTIPKGEEYRKGASLRTELVPGDPEDVATVQRIFRDARTLGLKRLADSLNHDGLTAPNGGKWSASSLRDVLMNPAYIGRRVVNRTSKARYHHHGKDGVIAKDEADQGREQLVRKPESEWSVWEGKHEALVDETTFNEVQEARNRRQGDKTWNRKGRNQDREYLLSAGFIECQRCGAGLNGTTTASKGYTYPKYYCSSNRRHGPSVCAGYSLPMDALDEFVLNDVRESVTTPDCLAALADGLEREFTRHLELHKPLGAVEAKALKAEEAEIERARRQIADAIKASPAAIELMKPEIERLAAQSEALKRKLQQAKPALDKSKIKDLVAKGLAFYEERVLGPMAATALKTATMVEGAAEANVLEEKGGAVPKHPEKRPCTTELKELLRLLDVKLTYDPDRKEGTLEFDPFMQSAIG